MAGQQARVAENRTSRSGRIFVTARGCGDGGRRSAIFSTWARPEVRRQVTIGGPSRRSGGRSSKATIRAVLSRRSSPRFRSRRIRIFAILVAPIFSGGAANLSTFVVQAAATSSHFGRRTKVTTGGKIGRSMAGGSVAATRAPAAVIIYSAAILTVSLAISASSEGFPSSMAIPVFVVTAYFGGVGMHETGSVCCAAVSGHFSLGFS